jgi:SEC-C motif-containing protein
MKISAPCPCESGKRYDSCCGCLIEGEQVAATAEALMRSRYTAFVEKNWDYLVMTHHPDTRSPQLKRALEELDDNPQWSGLKIVSTVGGGESDKTGKVNFEASYFVRGKGEVLKEHSRFKRYKGFWMYVDGKG